MCSSRKYPYPPQGWSMEVLRGRGSPYLGKEGSNKMYHPWGGMDIFWNHAILLLFLIENLQFGLGITM